MESETPPTKLPRIALHDGSTAEPKRSERDFMKDAIFGSTPNSGGEGSNQTGGIGLFNRLGSNSRKCGFTFLQMQELKHQALIYKYMEAGVLVPFNLVLPIWKSMSSLSGIHVMGCSAASVYCNHRNNSMEAEPGRCRRTDGKKWRCSKNVVPNHKYCQRHLHRGGRTNCLHTPRNQAQVSSSISASNNDHQICNTDVDLSL